MLLNDIICYNEYRAYGRVYAAEHSDTEFRVAIKCLPLPESMLSTNICKELDQLRKEIGILKKCRSPHIVSYYGVCFRNSSLWVRNFFTPFFLFFLIMFFSVFKFIFFFFLDNNGINGSWFGDGRDERNRCNNSCGM